MKQKIFNYLITKEWFMVLVRELFIEAIENVEFNSHSEGCGLEDRNIQDRYEAMGYGWDRCLERVNETIENV